VEVCRGNLDVLDTVGAGAAEITGIGTDQLGDAKLLAGHVVRHLGIGVIKIERHAVLPGGGCLLDFLQRGFNVNRAPDDCRLNHFQQAGIVVEHEAGVDGQAGERGLQVEQEALQKLAVERHPVLVVHPFNRQHGRQGGLVKHPAGWFGGFAFRQGDGERLAEDAPGDLRLFGGIQDDRGGLGDGKRDDPLLQGDHLVGQAVDGGGDIQRAPWLPGADDHLGALHAQIRLNDWAVNGYCQPGEVLLCQALVKDQHRGKFTAVIPGVKLRIQPVVELAGAPHGKCLLGGAVGIEKDTHLQGRDQPDFLGVFVLQQDSAGMEVCQVGAEQVCGFLRLQPAHVHACNADARINFARIHRLEAKDKRQQGGNGNHPRQQDGNARLLQGVCSIGGRNGHAAHGAMIIPCVSRI